MTYKQLLYGLAIAAASFSLNAHSPNDSQGDIYEGLQDLNQLAEVMGLDREQSLGIIGKNNLVSSLLSPWDAERVNKAITFYGDIKAKARQVIKGAFSATLYDTSGFVTDVQPFLDLVDSSSFLQAYHAEARGITLDDTDALFVPADSFLTKHLAGTANTASDQKSSSTRIPANTPVYILGQLIDLPNISADEDSWFLIWRPEFGLKFARSRHIGRLSTKDMDKYKHLVTSSPEIVRTARVERHFFKHNYAMLMPGTMPLRDGSQFWLANRNGSNGELVQIGSDTWTVYAAELTPATLQSKEKKKKGIPLGYHLKQAPIQATVGNYLHELHNAIFYYPDYSGTNNYHRSFAWGEGTTGIDEQHGQDISNFVYKLMLGFGLRLPRFSKDQILDGMAINTIAVDSSTNKDSHYKTLVEHCTLGRMAAFVSAGHMVCLGSISMAQLATLDTKAYADALTHGMAETDLIPLVASSPVGFRDTITDNWSILPKAAVFPIFKTGPYSNWISREHKFQVFSFFKGSPKLTIKTEL